MGERMNDDRELALLEVFSRAVRHNSEDGWLPCTPSEYEAVVEWHHENEVVPLMDTATAEAGYQNVTLCGVPIVPVPPPE